MLKAMLCGCVFAGCLGLFSIPANAQQVVHALTGTVSSVDDLSKTLIVFQDNGTEGQFRDMTKAKTHIAMDKKITLDTTADDSVKKKGSYVIVFYVGDSEDRAVVALKSLGAGPFTSTTGTVVKYEGKKAITVTDSTGATQVFKITEQTVAESYMGVMEGSKFQAQKGDRVRVVGTADNAGATALFVRAM